MFTNDSTARAERTWAEVANQVRCTSDVNVPLTGIAPVDGRAPRVRTMHGMQHSSKACKPLGRPAPVAMDVLPPQGEKTVTKVRCIFADMEVVPDH